MKYTSIILKPIAGCEYNHGGKNHLNAFQLTDLKFETLTKDYFKAKRYFLDSTNKSHPYSGHKYNP